jgi:hypothetical protein
LSLLLHVEMLARRSSDLIELGHVIANETRKLCRARQVIVITAAPDAQASVYAVSGAVSVDPTSIIAKSIGELIANLSKERGLAAPVVFTIPAYCEANSELAKSYPFREMSWIPFLDRGGAAFGGMLLAREQVWTADETAISERLGQTYAHAWRALAPPRPMSALRRNISRRRLAIAMALLALLVLPVRLTALAPAEIVAKEPMIIAAPIDGVIEEIPVDPSAMVNPGAILIKFSDIMLRNRQEVARREVAVAEAKVKQLTLLSFNDAKGRHEVGLAETELALRRTELSYASEMLERSIVRANRPGLAVYSDRKSLIGRPVATGERLMEIADPSAVEVRIDVAAADAIALNPDSRVKLFLDVDPLNSWQAQVVRADYKARASESDVLSFRAIARLDGSERRPPRIGLRGTAQVYGDRAPLAIVLLRRPLSAARQWLGL